MNDFETLRRRHLAHALTIAPGLIERLDWSADRVAAERTEKLRRLLTVAVERSPWHRKRLSSLDVAAFDEQRLTELPVMTKRDLVEHFDDIVTDARLNLRLVNHHLEGGGAGNYLLEEFTAIASSGSTGPRAAFVYDRDGWAQFYVGIFRNLFRALDTDERLRATSKVVANVAAAHPTHATAALSHTFSGPHLVSLRFPVTLPIEAIVAGLNEAQPAILHGYPSALHFLTHEARAGRLRIAPQRILASSEPLLPEAREAIEDTWGVPVGNWWGSSEGGAMAMPCDLARTHLSDDLLIIEAVDESFRPVPPGERSAKILLTNLYNTTLPLIRYEITDEVTVLDERCACGSAFRLIGDIQGRLDDTFVYGGRPINAHVFRSPLSRRSEIVEYQVRQTPDGVAVSIRCTGEVDTAGLAAEITAALQALGLDRPAVTISVVDHLDRQATGKLKRFIPLLRR
jgi:phenylacetate-coenzyme A ligase PaaK-like adenylate-forming protein